MKHELDMTDEFKIEFKSLISEIVKSEIEWEGDTGSLKILDARLVDKN